MEKKKNWVYGGIIGLLIGTVLFLSMTWNQFITNIKDLGVWRMFIVVILEPAVAGALLVLAYEKIMKINFNKLILWIIYLIIVGVIIGLTIIWFMALGLGVGIVGL